MGKDGGQSNSATQIQDIPEWAQPYSRSLLQSGAAAANLPYTQYEGMKIAPLNEAQNAAMGLTAGTALQGNPVTNAALGSTYNTLMGNNENPWATTWNPYAVSGNPELEKMIANTASGITDNYGKAIAPKTDALFAMSGAFGGSAYTDAKTADQKALLGALSSADTGARFNDYTQKANLSENALNRGSSAYEAERSRQMEAARQGLQGDTVDFNRAAKLGGAGDAQGKYSQDLLNEMYAEFERQQQYPWQQIDKLGAVLGKSLGGASQTTTTTSAPYQYGGVAGALGGGMAGYGLGQMSGNPMIQQFAPWLGAGLGAFT